MSGKITYVVETDQDFTEYLASLETIIREEISECTHPNSDSEEDGYSFTYETPVLLFSISK